MAHNFTIHVVPGTSGFMVSIDFINSTFQGLFKDNKERPILEVLQAIVRCKDSLDFDTFSDEEIEALYQCIRRLVASKVGFQAFTQLQG